MVEVSAALIFQKGRFLVCQRPAHKARGLLWEFAGGKVETGETGEEALVRECREELGVTLSVGDVFMSLIHHYPDITVRLTLYHASIVRGSPQKLEHRDLRWITPEEIPQFNFCPADTAILEKLQADFQDRTARISAMEQLMNQSEAAVQSLSAALAPYRAAQEQLRKLAAYYEGPLWRRDLDADQAQLIPDTLKRGVLSEDGIYNLLGENDALLQELHALSQRYLRQEEPT